MKKTNVLGLMTILLGLFLFVGCSSSDDEGGVGGKETLLGSWIETRIEGWEMDSRYGREDLTEDVDPEEATVLIFNEDGTYTEIWYPRETTRTGIYRFDADKKELTLIMGHTEVFKVETLTSSTLAIVEDDGEDAYIKTIYKRRN